MKKYCDVENIGLDILMASHVFSPIEYEKVVFGSLLFVFMYVHMYISLAPERLDRVIRLWYLGINPSEVGV
jgi:hypothetical protein